MVAKFVIKHDKKVQRFLEIVPGFLTWSIILSPIWLSLLYYPAMVYLLTFVTIYWSFLAIKGTFRSFAGYRRLKTELKTDWMGEIRKLDHSKLPEKETLPSAVDDVRHFVLIPVVNEPYEVLKPSIDSIFEQTFPSSQTVLVFTAEEKYAEQVKETIDLALDGREELLDGTMFFVHPAGIIGEAKGVAGANRRWGAINAVETLKKQGKNLRNYIFTTIDCDHVLHEQFMARTTHLYLTSDKRDNKFYTTAVMTFNNNNWKVPAMMRIEANFVTLGSLSDWALHKPGGSNTRKTFSAYTTSLQTLIDADYWDPALGVDDTIYYWRAFFVRDGDFTGVAHYIPISADAVQGKNYWDSYRSMYKQLLRWGYGVIDFPLSVGEFLKNDRIPFSKKVAWIVNHLHIRVFLINLAFLITFGFGIATLVNPDIKQTSFAYSLPHVTSIILTFTMMFLIPGVILRSKISKPMPTDWPMWKKALVLLEGPLVLVNLLTYSFIPFVDAQTRMMFGKKMKELYHTPKIRK